MCFIYNWHDFKAFSAILVCFVCDFRPVLVTILRSGDMPLISMCCLEILDFLPLQKNLGQTAWVKSFS